MTYRNRKTGELIITSNRVGGKNWEQVEDTAPVSADEQGNTEAATTEEETAETAPTAEGKPKRTRRSNK